MHANPFPKLVLETENMLHVLGDVGLIEFSRMTKIEWL